MMRWFRQVVPGFRELVDLARVLLRAVLTPGIGVSWPIVYILAYHRAHGTSRSCSVSAVPDPLPESCRVSERCAESGVAQSPGAVGSSPSVASDAPVTIANATGPELRWLAIRIPPAFTPGDYAQAFADLQRWPGCKILDLSGVHLLSVDMFTALAAAWRAPASVVPRLALVLQFERWVLLRSEAIAALHSVAAHGVEVAICYEEQYAGGQVVAWFERGQLVHNTPAVVATLMRWWRPSPIWPMVIHTLAELVRGDSGGHDVAGLLCEVAGLALTCGGAELAEPLAREALSRLDGTPSITRCKALRRLGSALLGLGQMQAGLDILEQAIAVAVQCEHPLAGASAHAQLGVIALNGCDYAGAEHRFRVVVDLLSVDVQRPDLLAFAHRGLALALMHQGREDAEHHARAALALHVDPESEQAAFDRRLVTRLGDVN